MADKKKKLTNKETMSTEEIISWRFDNMLVMAKEINTRINRDGILQLANKDKYLRICGEKFRPISLAEETALSGYGNKSYSRIEKALDCFENQQANKISPKILKTKRERRLQSWLIREALRNDRSLKKTFGTLREFDDILFALDEVSMGDKNHPYEDGKNDTKPIVRCDLLCIGHKNDQWHLLVVELKSNREDINLVNQVERYANALAKFRTKIDPLLEVITGKSISQGEILKMVIFPKADNNKHDREIGCTYKLQQVTPLAIDENSLNKRARQTYENYEKNGVILVEYSTDTSPAINK